MKRNSLLFSLMLLLCIAPLRAQESSATDSVIVMGTVVDHLTGVPQPYCRLHFIQGADTAATLLCDNEGFFLSEGLSTGSYTLSVTLRGQQVYRSDLVLNDNAALHVAIITDSIIFRNLQSVEVTALKHLLGPLQIVSKKDTRLWDFCYRGTPWELERDGNAAVATPTTLHPLYGDNPCSEGEMGCCRPNKYYSQSFGLEVSSLNSAMKNELLREGRIRDVLYPAPADTTKTD